MLALAAVGVALSRGVSARGWARSLRSTRPERVSKLRGVLARRRGGLDLVIDQPPDEFELCAILRTVEGLGIQHVHVIERSGGSYPFDSPPASASASTSTPRPPTGRRRAKKKKKASLIGVAMGAARWVSLHKYRSARECLTALKQKGADVYCLTHPPREGVGKWCLPLEPQEQDSEAPSPHAPVPVGSLPLKAGQPVALVFGCRKSERMASYADRSFYLPVSGVTQVASPKPSPDPYAAPNLPLPIIVITFNLSLSCAIAIHAVLMSGHFGEGTLTEEERDELLARWIMRDLRAAKHILKQKIGFDFREVARLDQVVEELAHFIADPPIRSLSQRAVQGKAWHLVPSFPACMAELRPHEEAMRIMIMEKLSAMIFQLHEHTLDATLARAGLLPDKRLHTGADIDGKTAGFDLLFHFVNLIPHKKLPLRVKVVGLGLGSERRVGKARNRGGGEGMMREMVTDRVQIIIVDAIDSSLNSGERYDANLHFGFGLESGGEVCKGTSGREEGEEKMVGEGSGEGITVGADIVAIFSGAHTAEPVPGLAEAMDVFSWPGLSSRCKMWLQLKQSEREEDFCMRVGDVGAEHWHYTIDSTRDVVGDVLRVRDALVHHYGVSHPTRPEEMAEVSEEVRRPCP
ncbi:MAG: hypothetical protein SGPRY_006387 [Prymnesium sp.]